MHHACGSKKKARRQHPIIFMRAAFYVNPHMHQWTSHSSPLTSDRTLCIYCWPEPYLSLTSKLVYIDPKSYSSQKYLMLESNNPIHSDQLIINIQVHSNTLNTSYNSMFLIKYSFYCNIYIYFKYNFSCRCFSLIVMPHYFHAFAFTHANATPGSLMTLFFFKQKKNGVGLNIIIF